MRPTHDQRGLYTPIGESEDGAAGEGSPPVCPPLGASDGAGYDAKVYWAFWTLGAGVLLSWNGESSLQRSARSTQRLVPVRESTALTSPSPHLLHPPVDLVLPRVLATSRIARELPQHDLLLR
jgi:hypothetical protein